MVTGRRIGIRIGDNVESVYCHDVTNFDAFCKMLIEDYSTLEKAKSLIALGDINDIYTAELEDGTGDHQVIEAYHRDLHEPWENVRPRIMTFDEYKNERAENPLIVSLYMYQDDQWMIDGRLPCDSNDVEFIPLKRVTDWFDDLRRRNPGPSVEVMDKHSFIGVQYGDKIKRIYCGDKRNPEYVGNVLLNFYSSDDRIESLMSLGGIATLEPKISSDDGGCNDDPVTIAYHRDKGEEYGDYIAESCDADISNEVMITCSKHHPYIYLFRDGKWWIYSYRIMGKTKYGYVPMREFLDGKFDKESE